MIKLTLLATVFLIFVTPSLTESDKNRAYATEHLGELASSDQDNFLRVVFVDLGTKGESILIMFPNNNTMLVDGGMPSSYTALKSTLRDYGVSEIDAIVGTHPDQDHIAGLTKILDDSDFEVGQVLISHVQGNTATYRNFLEKTVQRGLEPQTVFSGHTIDLDDSVITKIISPPIEGIPDGPNASLANSNALVLLIEYDNVSFLLTSDATYTTEEWLVKQYESLDVDIMNGPHHGSKYSSTDQLIDQITPNLVIFSADRDNEYGHPHEEAISKYASRGISYYQTGIEGNIMIKTDGSRCSLILAGELERPCYTGIQTVPEFSLIVLIFAASVFIVLLASRKRLENRI